MRPTFAEAFRVWAYVALHSFGGPAGQIAVMHRVLVKEKGWISEERFLHALNYCMLLPGPEAQQLATYIGWLHHGVPGGLMAGGLFVLPGFLCILALSLAYALFQGTTVLATLFFGIKAAVIGVVLEAVLRVGKRALANRLMWGIAAISFLAIFFLKVPFPWIIVGAAAFGYVGGKIRPDLFERKSPEEPLEEPRQRPSLGRTLLTAAFWAILWLAPVGVLYAVLGPGSVFTQQGLFFSQAAMVTFGGAYSVLAYIAQKAVQTYGWLRPGEMLDGLGMAETTPGPLIQVVGFVAFMGAFRHPGGLSPLVAGVLGSVLTTWVTYAPCFLWIFTGAPYMEELRRKRGLNHALSAITASVVGVILNLSVWFAIHTLFREVHEGGAPSGLDPWALLIATGATVALLRFHQGMLRVLAVSALAGVLVRLATG